MLKLQLKPNHQQLCCSVAIGNLEFPDPVVPEKFDIGDMSKSRHTFWPVGLAGSCLLRVGGAISHSLRIVGGVVGLCLLIRVGVLNSSGLRNL